MQGFVGLDDATLYAARYWLRLAPAICLIWTAVGTALAEPMILWALMPFAAMGGVLRGHPFDVIYHQALRYWLGGRPLPTYRAPRRFACVLATVWVGAAALAFQAGLALIGYALGGSLMLLATVQVSTGFCVPSFIYRGIFGFPTCPLANGAGYPT
jgi:hypothetical protein